MDAAYSNNDDVDYWTIFNWINSLTSWLDSGPGIYSGQEDYDGYQTPFGWNAATAKYALVVVCVILGIPTAFFLFIFVVILAGKLCASTKAWGADRRRQARRRWQALQVRWSPPRPADHELQPTNELTSGDKARSRYWRDKVLSKLSRNAGGNPDQPPLYDDFVEYPLSALTADALRYVGYMV
ncbi:hypothetical protein NLG97_g746 [Lecanicillium saksenae]|uniref:Uncharacterized protein n=1 Tax=Lecanicillium saksenae TaxID=468837 RepID=A0ACC1R7G6_9HYPO|nr:hypothetical protein NLG97_g746 [Lecanicillium saksenae]